MVVHTATVWGWMDPYNTYKARKRVANAACTQVAYDHGYANKLAVSQLPYWFAKIHEAIAFGEKVDPLSPSQSVRYTYVDSIENAFPGYLHELWRYAQKVHGVLATFTDLANCMNEKSACPGETRATLSLSRKTLSRWFKNNGGKEKRAIEKPLLTTTHKEQRKDWATQHFDIISDETKPVVYLDEKWFYTTSRRKRMKILPKASWEEADPLYAAAKIRSRRYPVKVMYLAVVACPLKSHNFNGKIFLKRVSRRERAKRMSRNQWFTTDVLLNNALKNGSWKQYVVGDYTISECIDSICVSNDLDKYVAERLEFSYCTYSAKGIKKIKSLLPTQVISELGMLTTEANQTRAITVDDLNLHVVIKAGEYQDKDCSCDSEFMLKTIPEIGEAVRSAYHWLEDSEPIYIIMDNAGGHGTDDAKQQYTESLAAYNIGIIWQVPRSPETNMLDLGIWMSIQSAVERAQRGQRCHHATLAKSVENAWTTYLQEESFKRVHGRLRVVLRCIMDDNGGNNKVEEKRGLLFRDCNLIDLPEENTHNNETMTVTNIIEDDVEDDDESSISST